MKLRLVFVLAPLLILVACTPTEEQARNSAAALKGAIEQAQTQYDATCHANNGQKPCQIINQAVNGQNALITAIEAYCGWSQAAPPPDGTQKCVPVKTAAEGLKTAVANADLFVVELKGVIK